MDFLDKHGKLLYRRWFRAVYWKFNDPAWVVFQSCLLTAHSWKCVKPSMGNGVWGSFQPPAERWTAPLWIALLTQCDTGDQCEPWARRVFENVWYSLGWVNVLVVSWWSSGYDAHSDCKRPRFDPRWGITVESHCTIDHITYMDTKTTTLLFHVEMMKLNETTGACTKNILPTSVPVV